MNLSERYERDVAALFESAGPSVDGVRVVHRDVVAAADGSYEIDTTMRFQFAELEFVVLVEAKLQGRPVDRSTAQVLHQKVQSTGAHKGVLVSSSGYQRGALVFAAAHGIALFDYAGGRREVRLRGPVDPTGAERLWHEVTPAGTLRPLDLSGDWLARLVAPAGA
jgi:hypothetical protein